MKEAFSIKASNGVKVGQWERFEAGQEGEPVPFSFPLYVFTKELLGIEKILFVLISMIGLHKWSWWSGLATAKDCEDVLNTWKYFACDIGNLFFFLFLFTSLDKLASEAIQVHSC